MYRMRHRWNRTWLSNFTPDNKEADTGLRTGADKCSFYNMHGERFRYMAENRIQGSNAGYSEKQSFSSASFCMLTTSAQVFRSFFLQKNEDNEKQIYLDKKTFSYKINAV